MAALDQSSVMYSYYSKAARNVMIHRLMISTLLLCVCGYQLHSEPALEWSAESGDLQCVEPPETFTSQCGSRALVLTIHQCIMQTETTTSMNCVSVTLKRALLTQIATGANEAYNFELMQINKPEIIVCFGPRGMKIDEVPVRAWYTIRNSQLT